MTEPLSSGKTQLRPNQPTSQYSSMWWSPRVQDEQWSFV